MPVEYNPLKGIIGKGTEKEKQEAKNEWFERRSGSKPVTPENRPQFEAEMRELSKRIPFTPKRKTDSISESEIENAQMRGEEKAPEYNPEKLLSEMIDLSPRFKNFADKQAFERGKEKNIAITKKLEEQAEKERLEREKDYKPIKPKVDQKFVSVGDKTLPIPQDFSIDSHFSQDMATGKRFFDYENKPWRKEEVENLMNFIEQSGGNIEDYRPLFEKWNIPSLEEFEKEEVLGDYYGV